MIIIISLWLKKTQDGVKHSLWGPKGLIAADPKEIISSIEKSNLKLSKDYYNDGRYKNELLNYRKDIAKMLDKADLHNEARGKLVENYFEY